MLQSHYRYSATTPACIQGLEERLLVDEWPTRRVDNVFRGLHTCQLGWAINGTASIG